MSPGMEARVIDPPMFCACANCMRSYDVCLEVRTQSNGERVSATVNTKSDIIYLYNTSDSTAMTADICD